MSLLLLVVALIVSGSLYPWHFSAVHGNPFLVLCNSWPLRWDIFTLRDAFVNIPAYAPCGALAFLALARRHSAAAAAIFAICGALLLSLGMELAQVYVPGRDPSLFDVLCNVTGAALGALAVGLFQKSGIRFRREVIPPSLMLVSWASFHFYPFLPSIKFARVRFELWLWLHPLPLSPIDIWIYAVEWVAFCAALQWLFGRVRPQWLLAALALHLAARPIMVSIPFSPDEGLGALLAVLLWKTLPAPVRSGPWLVFSTIFLRGFAPLHGPATDFSWLPFQMLLTSARGDAIIHLSRAVFDYAAILWLSHCRGISYSMSGVVLTGSLALLAAAHRYLPGDPLTMTDPAVALLLAIWFCGIGPKPVLGPAAPPYPSQSAL